MAALLEWLLAGLLLANLWWTTLCLGGYRPETMVVTVVLHGLFSAVFLLGAIAGILGFSGGGAVLPLVPFAVYAFANVLWVTPVQWLGWQDWLYWAQSLLVFWVASCCLRRAIVRETLIVGMFTLAGVSTVLGIYQRYLNPEWLMLGRVQAEQFVGRSSGPFGIPNSLAALLLLLLPAALAVTMVRGKLSRGWRWASAFLAALLGFGLFLTISRGGWISIVLALGCWPLFVSRWTLGKRFGGAAIVFAALVAATFVAYQASPRVHDRIDILIRDRGEVVRPILWRAALAMARSEPWFGTGAGSFNVEIEKYRPEGFRDDPQWAHNEYLNTLSDYGVVGFVLLFGGVASTVVVVIRRRSRGRSAGGEEAETSWVDAPLVRTALGVGLLAFAMQLFVDFHFKIPALGMAVAASAALLAGGSQGRGQAGLGPDIRARVAAGAALVILVLLVGVIALPHYRSEAARYGPRRDIDAMALRNEALGTQRPVVERARAAFARATEIEPSNAQAWSDLSYATALWSHQESERSGTLGAEAETHARRAIALAPEVFEFHIRLGVALDMQGRYVEAGESFTEALRLAPMRSLSWYHLAFHQSLQPATRKLAASAIATSLRLDPGNATAEALRQQLSAGN
jgi:O-antigen ligase/cytochrome c-type biogenesis protein CcmH/NrfG